MTNSNLREAIRAAFHDSGLSLEDFDAAMDTTLNELYEEEKNTAICGLDCMSLPWDSFFDNIIFPYIVAQIPECSNLADLSHDDELYTTLRSETKTFFISISELHSLLSNPNDKNPINTLLSTLLR